MVTLYNTLRDSLWAEALTPEQFERVRSQTRERRVPADGSVVRIDEPADQWIGVIDGLVKICVSLPGGGMSTLVGVPSSGWFGEGTLLQHGTWRFDGVAVRDTRIACMPRETFEWLQRTSLPFNRFLVTHINARLSQVIGLVAYDRLLGPQARVARCLAGMFDTRLYPRIDKVVKLNQREVGLLAGVSRQRANAALHQLEQEGLLKIEFGGLTVLDLDGLRSYACDRKPRAGLASVATPTGQRQTAGDALQMAP